jgi:hypothetical protein
MTRSVAVASLLVWSLSGAPVTADTVTDWNATLLSVTSGQNPFAQARLAAITQVAVFEAVNAVTREHRPYLGTVTASPGASAEAAAAAAAHAVLKTYFPASAASLDAALASSLALVPDGAAEDAGVAVGEAAAAALVALRADDGSAAAMPYTPPSGPGFWQPTPPAFGPGILLHWGTVTPFGIVSGDQFRAGPPPALTSRRYARDYAEVKRLGGTASDARPADRAEVARFFAAVGAPGVWNQAATQVSAAQRRSLSQNARLLALLNMAINDGLISSQETKYAYHFWRPVTAIRAGDTDANPLTAPDPAFTPFVATPAFPSYPSAHASASYAARAVLERILGRGCHAIVLSNVAATGLTLYYTSFREITRDIDDARIYGGIHFRFDQEAGAVQGTRVGAYVYRHNLRRVHGRHGQLDADATEE